MALVPEVADEQRVLLSYASQHATGSDGRLFGTRQNFERNLRAAAEEAKLASLAPHDLRRAACHRRRQWEPVPPESPMARAPAGGTETDVPLRAAA